MVTNDKPNISITRYDYITAVDWLKIRLHQAYINDKNNPIEFYFYNDT